MVDQLMLINSSPPPDSTMVDTPDQETGSPVSIPTSFPPSPLSIATRFQPRIPLSSWLPAAVLQPTADQSPPRLRAALVARLDHASS